MADISTRVDTFLDTASSLDCFDKWSRNLKSKMYEVSHTMEEICKIEQDEMRTTLFPVFQTHNIIGYNDYNKSPTSSSVPVLSPFPFAPPHPDASLPSDPRMARLFPFIGCFRKNGARTALPNGALARYRL